MTAVGRFFLLVILRALADELHEGDVSSDESCFQTGFDYGNPDSGACNHSLVYGLFASEPCLESLTSFAWWPHHRAKTKAVAFETPTECQAACLETAGCDFFVFRTVNDSCYHACWMKSALDCQPAYTLNPGNVAGPRCCEGHCPTSTTTTSTTTTLRATSLAPGVTSTTTTATTSTWIPLTTLVTTTTADVTSPSPSNSTSPSTSSSTVWEETSVRTTTPVGSSSTASTANTTTTSPSASNASTTTASPSSSTTSTDDGGFCSTLPSVASASNVSFCLGTPSGEICEPECPEGHEMAGSVACVAGRWNVSGFCAFQNSTTEAAVVAKLSMVVSLEGLDAPTSGGDAGVEWAEENIDTIVLAVARLLNISASNILVEIVPNDASEAGSGRRLSPRRFLSEEAEGASFRLNVIINMNHLDIEDTGTGGGGGFAGDLAEVLPGGFGNALTEELEYEGKNVPFTASVTSVSPVEISSGFPFPLAEWRFGDWGFCSSDCGTGVQRREVLCTGGSYAACLASAPGPEPVSQRPCEGLGVCHAAASGGSMWLLFLLALVPCLGFLGCQARSVDWKGRAQEAKRRVWLAFHTITPEEQEEIDRAAQLELQQQYETWQHRTLERLGSRGEVTVFGLDLPAAYRILKKPALVDPASGIDFGSNCDQESALQPEKVHIVWDVDAEEVIEKIKDVEVEGVDSLGATASRPSFAVSNGGVSQFSRRLSAAGLSSAVSDLSLGTFDGRPAPTLEAPPCGVFQHSPNQPVLLRGAMQGGKKQQQELDVDVLGDPDAKSVRRVSL